MELQFNEARVCDGDNGGVFTIATGKYEHKIDHRGKVRERSTTSFRKNYGEERRTAIFFTGPKNIKDTAFLTFDYPEVERDDDQWLYLSALRKVRRISASKRGDYFLGTDFTYEDIKNGGKIKSADYNFKTLRLEKLDGKNVYLLEAVPNSEEIGKELGYSKIHFWVDSVIRVILPEL